MAQRRTTDTRRRKKSESAKKEQKKVINKVAETVKWQPTRQKTGRTLSPSPSATQKNVKNVMSNSRLGQSESAQRCNNQPVQRTNRQNIIAKTRGNEHLSGLTKGAAQQSIGGARKSVFGTMENSGAFKNSGKATGTVAHRNGNNIVQQKGGNDRRTQAQKNLNKIKGQKIIRQKNKIAKIQRDEVKKQSGAASAQIDRGTKAIENEKKGMSSEQKWLSDLYVGGVQFGMDAAAGAATGGSALPFMFARSYGSSMDRAEKEGASEKQAIAYGAASGALEVGTEKIGSVAKPLKKVYGKGITEKLTDKVLDKMVSKATKQGTKNLAYHGGKITMSAITEGLEEMVAEGLEPSIANKIYADAAGKPHSTSAKDILYAGSIGAALGGALGTGGQVVEYSQGNNVKENENIFGKGGLKDLAKKAKEVNEDTGDHIRAAALSKMIDEGDGIASGQANDLYKIVARQEQKDADDFDTAQRATVNIMRRNGFQDIMKSNENGETVFAENTRRVFNEKAEENEDKIKSQMPDMTDENIAGNIALVQVGAAGVDTVNLFTTSNPEIRKAYEVATGETLPKTNMETKGYLYKKIAENRIASSEAETDYQMGAARGIIAQRKNITGPAGQEIYSKAVESINPVNETQALALSDTFDAYHEAGRSGIDFDYVNSLGNPLHKMIPLELRMEMYEAGQSDKIMEISNVKGMQLRINEALDKTLSNPNSKARKGTLISELSTENMKALTLKRQSMFRYLAKAFNLEVHIVDTLGNGGNKVNGFYKDGIVYLSMDADRSLEYVFAHEITHHMQQYAPEEYVKLKDLLREKWFEGDMKEVIDSKISVYAEGNITLTREEALDEVISDSTYEFLNDENFVNEVCKGNTGIAQSIIDSIKNILRKLRAVFAQQESYEPEHNAGLLSNLGILSDMEQLWVSGLAKAAENKDAVGMIDSNTNQASIGEGGYNGKSMSNRAVRAYEDGKMPLSKWNKKAILEAIEDYSIDNNIDYNSLGIERLTLKELRDNFIKKSSWHHTGAFYNQTDFYSLDENALEGINRKTIDEIIDDRAPARKKSAEEKAQQKRNTQALEEAKNMYAKLDTIFKSGVTGLKSLNSVYSRWQNGSMDLEAVYNEAVKAIKDKDSSKIKEWMKLPDGHWRKEYVDLYNNDIEQYISKTLLNDKTSSKVLQSIKNSLLNEDIAPVKFSLSEATDKTYLDAVNRGDMETVQRMVDEAAKRAGYTEKLYHQTGATLFTEFNTENQKAGKYDSEMPTGIFMKPTKDDIGLKGKSQLPIYAKIENPLVFEDREQAKDYWIKNVDGYNDALNEIESIDEKYNDEYAKADIKDDELYSTLRKQLISKEIDENQFDKMVEQTETKKILSEWADKSNEARSNAKTLIDDYINNSEYDGIILNNDSGSFGRKTKAYVAFDSYQLKSGNAVTYNNANVIPLSQRFNEDSNDIRFSLKDTNITYDDLVKKPYMKIVKVTTASSDIMNLKRKDIANKAKSRLENKVGLDSENRTVVHNSDTDSDIIVGKPGIEHGLDRNYNDTAIVSMHLDEYLKNAIKINEAFPDTNRKHYSDVLLGYGENEFGERIPAYFVISKLKTGKDKLIEFGSLYSVRGKKIEDDSAQGSPGVQSRTSSIISISNLLDIVNEMYSEILPKSVAEHYGNERKVSKLGENVKFSLKETDTEGNTLSQGQQAYFKDSKVRDDNGNLFVMYHGTPNAGFTEFKTGTYFTGNPVYADIYQEPGASSISGAKGSTNPSTYKVYLNIVKPFDTRNPKEREIFETEFYRQWGTGTPLMERGLPDWTDGMDLQEFIEEMGYDYDGLILDEGGTGGYENEVNDRGLSYVTFTPNQAKNIDNQNPTDDPDIRFSLPEESDTFDYIEEHETEFMDATPFRDYEKTGRNVKDQSVKELQFQVERLKKDKRLTRGKVLDTRSIKEQFNTLVRTLMTRSDGTSKKTNSKLVKLALDNAPAMYKNIVSGDTETPALTAYYVAKDIVEGLEFVEDTMYEEYKELRAYLKNTPLKISDEDKNNIPDFNEFRKKNFGRLRLSKEGVPVDTVYEELCDLYPEMFNDGITHPADQLMAISDIRDSLEPYDIFLTSDETQQLIKQTAQDILDIVAYGKPWQSWADKQRQIYTDKLKKAKARQVEAREKAIDRVNDRWEKKYESQKQKTKDVKAAERARGEKKLLDEKQKTKERESSNKYKAEHKILYADIAKNVKWLSDRLTKPTDDKHIPEEFKTAVASLLSGIDLQTKGSKKRQTTKGKSRKTLHFEELRRQYEKLANEDGIGIFEYDGYISELMDALAEKLEGKTIDEATNAEMNDIAVLLRAIVHNVRTINNTFNEGIKENVVELGNDVIKKAEDRISIRGHNRNEYTGAKGGIDNILNSSMLTSRDLFDYLGGGLQKVFMGLRGGFDKHIDNITYLRGFFGELFGEYNNEKKPGSKIEKWRNDKNAQEFPTENGDKIRMSPAQVMSLYCLMKREQAQGHIMGAGIVATSVDFNSKIKNAIGAKKEIKGTTTMVSYDDVVKIISSLTEEQIAVADKMMELLNGKCQEWGNEASMALFGYKKFTEENYFPIQSVKTYLDTKSQDLNVRDIVKNYSFTKNTIVGANNPIVVDDIFTVVADHTNKMSLYNALSVPITDFYRVWNYKVKNEDGLAVTTVKAKIQDAYGQKVNKYIETFMNDVQSNTDNNTDSLTTFVTKSLARYKKATIGFNMRVALQQPTAVARALMFISPKYFVNKDINAIKNTKDMQEHCQIARWKSWGFSNVDMARGMNEIMMNREWSKIDVVSMRPYSFLDNLTWGAIWAAVRNETTYLHPDVEVNGDEFYKLCNARASEIFDKTQVVDSVFHKSQIMRKTDTMSKMITSFMAEPTRTFNMVRGQLVEAREMWEDGNKNAAVLKANKAMSVYVYNAALCAAAAAIADALRGKALDDDDEDKEGFDLWFANFLSNFADISNPLTLIPVVKDIWGFKDGWGTQNMAFEGFEAFVTASQSIIDKAIGNSDKSWGEVMRDMAEGIGLVMGVPVKNTMREIEVIFNKVGIKAFAADGTEEDMYTVPKDSLLDNVLEYFGLGKTDTEKRQKALDDRVEEIKKDLNGLSGTERQNKIWDDVTENYTKYIANGQYGKIAEMRKTLEALGGDVEKFDKNVLSKTKTAYKKTIGSSEDYGKQMKMKDFLISNGMTEGQISNSIVAKSEAAKEFQISCIENDEGAMIGSLISLIDAGISYEDANALYINKYKAINEGDVSTGELVNPVTGEITSTFGYRDAPTAGASSYHEGIDIAVAENSNVAAADGGKVSACGYNRGKGNYITISHGNGRYTEYYHLNGQYVQKGQPVSKGEVIALSGSTGVSTGPHLHFAVKENGTYVDPTTYFH